MHFLIRWEEADMTGIDPNWLRSAAYDEQEVLRAIGHLLRPEKIVHISIDRVEYSEKPQE